MRKIYINPTRRTLIVISVFLSMCICKVIEKPAYALFQEPNPKIIKEETNNLIIYKEENVVQENTLNTEQIENAQALENIPEETNTTNEVIANEASDEVVEEYNPWRLIIPQINLDAGVKEGTTPEILDKYIGHLENTSMFEGTVALCAHNRGYTKNYFSELNNLSEGALVEYVTLEYGKRQYKVISKQIIESSDWSYTEQGTGNRLVLITCVENEEHLRLVVICEVKSTFSI